MAKRHDENKDLMAVSRIGKILYGDKSIVINKASIVGIKMLGRLDYLIHYCGWHLVWSNKVFISMVNYLVMMINLKLVLLKS